MTVTLDDESGSPLITAAHLAELTDLTAFLYARLGLGSAVELSVTLVDEEEMERLHLEWMDLPGPTDVMSFPMDELRPGSPEQPVAEGTLGDIVLCPAVAQSQAETAGHSLSDELCLLTTHGMLHLLGHDHHEPAERTEMFGLQKALLEEFLGREAPVPTETDPAE
ncbi:rRNA maturation RNase YbeY [Nesterenkonia flava]|uniref:Endoribonuclease YbeY n=1 Tax=Nesterenkonia flava TaxID=469799 RepID=A0ABU1FPV1_9MICC|nr:rRNA maturation RNase YbeY [Nesterenkonia flava]MDR5710661.1 rRNA maturation RNase YbeY [Nesterenkonia flava]